MKKLAFISASALVCASVLVSCTSNRVAVNTFDDNLYFMSSDMKKAMENAVANNQPATFQNLGNSVVVPQENFSSKNVNPDYLARYGQLNTTSTDQDVVYFEDSPTPASSTSPNIDIYNSFTVQNFNSGWGNSAFSYGLNPFGVGMMGFSPFGMGFYDPFWGPNWGWRPGFNMAVNFGWGRPIYSAYNPYLGWGGFSNPYWIGNTWGSPWGRPIYTTGPIVLLSGNEYADRKIVYGARPSRGAAMSSGGVGVAQSSGTPTTARAQARESVARANAVSPRRLGSTQTSSAASRDFSTTQNEYYSNGRSRVVTTNTNNSAAATRTGVSRNEMQSARPNGYTSNTGRGYTGTSSRSTYNSNVTRSATNSPSYNRTTGTSSGTRAGFSSGRNQSSTYNSGNGSSRSSSSSSFSTPSRSSSGGSYSAPSRSSSGSSGSSSSGGSRGRGN